MSEHTQQQEEEQRHDLQEFPLQYLSQKAGKTFDFDLFDSSGAILLAKGEALTEEFIQDLDIKGVKVFQKFSGMPEIISKETIERGTQITEDIFTEIRKSKIMADGHFDHTNKMFEQILGSLDERIIKEGQLSLQSEVAGLEQFAYLHSINVACLALIWGMKQHLPPEQLLGYAQAAYYMDVGKNRVPVNLLQKEAPLEPQEKVLVQSHTQLGYLIINDYNNRNEDNEAAKLAKFTALLHHRKFNGQGYPAVDRLPMFRNFSYNDMQTEIKQLTILDYFTALIEERPYRKAYSPAHALRIVLNESYRSFDIAVVNLFLNSLGRSLNGGQPFFDTHDYVILRTEVIDSHGLHYVHEIAQVEQIQSEHLMRPVVSLQFDIEGKRKMAGNSINLTKDFSRQIVRVLKSYEAQKRMAALGVS